MINKVILIGKLQDDAATKATTNDKQMTKLVVRTSESYKKDGETKWQNEYHNCKLFGDWVVSTGLIDRLKKDVDVYVEGKLHTHFSGPRWGKNLARMAKISRINTRI